MIETAEIEVLGKKDTRSGFGEGLLEIGNKNKDVVALCADLTGSLKMNAFQGEFPDRFFQVGIAEANMMGLAAGMAIGIVGDAGVRAVGQQEKLFVGMILILIIKRALLFF